jgi:hypothetical protein
VIEVEQLLELPRITGNNSIFFDRGLYFSLDECGSSREC